MIGEYTGRSLARDDAIMSLKIQYARTRAAGCPARGREDRIRGEWGECFVIGLQ